MSGASACCQISKPCGCAGSVPINSKMDAGQPGLSPSRARSLRPHTPTSVPAFLPQPVSMIVLGDGEALFDQLEEEKSQACFIDRPSWYVGPSQHFMQLKKHWMA